MTDIKYDISNIVAQIETATGVKLKLVNQYDPEYIASGQISEEDLFALNFEFSGYSSYIKCPIYRLGNIEAIFNETILHLYDITSHI